MTTRRKNINSHREKIKLAFDLLNIEQPQLDFPDTELANDGGFFEKLKSFIGGTIPWNRWVHDYLTWHICYDVVNSISRYNGSRVDLVINTGRR